MNNYARMGILALAVSLQAHHAVATECVNKPVGDIGIYTCGDGVIEDVRNSKHWTPPIIIKGKKEQPPLPIEVQASETGKSQEPTKQQGE